MDPDANLREQRAIAAMIQQINDSADDDGTITAQQERDLCAHAERLAELVQALDQWITAGGFLPAGWRQQTASNLR